MAAIVLKNFVREHWTTASAKFSPPQISIENKAKIRQILPHGLADASIKIRTAVVIANIFVFADKCQVNGNCNYSSLGLAI